MTGDALKSFLANEGLLPNGRNCAALTGASNFDPTTRSVPVGPGIQGPSLDLA
ncbi:MAG: hypothetical protein H6862_00330 [Rhodospirillales bacterium]|nr:hypothetical protein [Rhodospirillales bacterium]